MECQNRSDKYIWSPHDAYFYKGLSELIVDIDRLIYLSLEKIRKDFVFINLSTDSLSEFINRDNEWLSAVKGKQVVLIAARKSEALANYWYYNSNMNRPGFPGEYFICELRLPDHRFRWKHNKLFLLLPEEYGPAFPAIVDCYTSPPT